MTKASREADAETRAADGPVFVPIAVRAQFLEILLPGVFSDCQSASTGAC